MQIETITTADKHSYQLRIFKTEAANAPVAVIFPAMSVRANFYDNVATALTESGMHAVIHELRGIESSNLRPNKGDDFGYNDLVETDWTATMTTVKQLFPNSRRLMLGNSLGGQLSALHLSNHPEAADALALIACCSVYYKGFPKKASTLLGTQTLNIIGQVLGYAPGKKLGFGGDEAKTLVADWARQARTGVYAHKNAPIDYEAAMARLEKPLFARAIKNDPLAPLQAVKNLLAKMPNCQLNFQEISAADIGAEKLTHFSWGKHPYQLAQQIADWFDGLEVPSAAPSP